MACATRPSNVRVYQFRHFGTVHSSHSRAHLPVGVGAGEAGCGFVAGAGAAGAAGFAGAGALAAALPLTPVVTERPRRAVRTESPMQSTTKNTKEPVVSLCISVAVPRGPNEACELEPPNAAATSAPLPCCSSTTRIRKKQTTMKRMIKRVYTRCSLLRPAVLTGSSVDDSPKSFHVKACPADQGAVDVLLPEQHGGVVGLDAATVEDPQAGRGGLPEQLPGAATQGGVCLLGLGRGGGLSRPDRPDRLVRERQVRRVEPLDRGALPFQHRQRLASLALLERLADAEDHVEAGALGRLSAGAGGGVALAEVLPPLRVAGDHPAHPELGEHRRRDLAGERAAVLPVAVLGADRDLGAGRDQHGRGEQRERRADDDLRTGPGHPLHQGLEVRLHRRDRPVHLPVGGDERPAAHAPSSRAATPGRVSPARNSSAAPPPVETWESLAASPACCTAATLSPPPTTVNAALAASAVAMASVPAANAGFSNTPAGPFQNTVRAVAMTFAMRSRVAGPMSRIISCGPTAPTAAVCAGASVPVATTASVGRITGVPRAAASARIFFAVPTRSASASERPTATPSASRKVFAMPPTSTTVSASRASAVSVSSLPEILAPPTTATNGRSGLSRTRESAAISRAIRGPAARSLKSLATPAVEAWARCALPNASFT